jgi:hypothetical protein
MIGPAQVASHDFITKRMEYIWDSVEKLEKLVGKDAVGHILMSL